MNPFNSNISKLVFIVILLSIIRENTFAQEQESFSPKNTLKINPFGYIIGQYQITYERFLDNRNSVQITMGLTEDIFRTETKRSGFLIIPEYRKHLDSIIDAPLYIALFYRYYKIDYEYEVENPELRDLGNQIAIEKRKTHAAGFVLGYIYKTGLNPIRSKDIEFIIDMFGGVQYKSVFVFDNFDKITGSWVVQPNGSDDFKVEPGNYFGLRLGVNLGVQF